METRQIQERLKLLGFDPGPIDGAWGRGSIAALKKFQSARGLKADGITGPKTMAALFPITAGAGLSSVPAPLTPPKLSVPPWVSEGRRKKGLTEKANRSTLMAWLRSDGKTLGDPAKLPWCGDFVETCIALTLPDERLPTNPYFAQNWKTFGTGIGRKRAGGGFENGAHGAVLVFVRPGGGHVGFYESEDATHFSVLGGNQSNSISVARIAKNRCIAIRWPTTFPQRGGAIATAAGTGGPVSTNEA